MSNHSVFIVVNPFEAVPSALCCYLGYITQQIWLWTRLKVYVRLCDLLRFRQNLSQVSLLWFENFALYTMDQYFDMVELA